MYTSRYLTFRCALPRLYQKGRILPLYSGSITCASGTSTLVAPLRVSKARVKFAHTFSILDRSCLRRQRPLDSVTVEGQRCVHTRILHAPKLRIKERVWDTPEAVTPRVGMVILHGGNWYRQRMIWGA